MYLKEVRIHGFKSFADRTVLKLRPGVTAIVGPNGCGKSNTADAIRWVLGEQSAKSLRAGSMQDVIFQGSDTRKPVNLCEVSLVFADCEKSLGTAFNEVEVTRRVHRDGGSDYFLNGKPCRLRDISRLFMDTGVGQVSYSFMLQGQIDQILSTNPAERRVIFEEAAGVTRYKTQRREALQKLTQVDANLARVTDVIEEVGRQMQSVRRQASKALRYQLIKRRLTHLDLAHGTWRATRLADAVARLGADAANARAVVADLGARMKEREDALEVLRGQRTELFQQLQDMQRQVYDLRAEKEQSESQAQFARVRIEEIRRRQEQIAAELEEIRGQREALADQTSEILRGKEAQSGVVGDSDRDYQARNAQLTAAQEQQAAAERNVQKLKQDFLVAEGGLTRLRSNCVALEVELKGFQVRRAALGEEAHAQRTEVELLDAEVRRLESAAANLAAELAREEESLQVLRGGVQQSRERERSLRTQVQEAEKALSGLAAQAGALERMQEQLVGFGDGAKAALQGRLGETLPAESCLPLVRELEVDAEWAPALETLLGPALDMVKVGRPAQAAAAVAALREGQLGRAVFLFDAPAPATTTLQPAEVLPDWLRPASALVRARQESLSGAVRNLLNGCHFCTDLDAFLAFWEAHPAFDFRIVATPSGEWIDRRGLIGGGRQSGKEPDSHLRREEDLRRLRARMTAEEASLDKVRTEADTLARELSTRELEVEDKRQLIVEIGNERSTAAAQLRAAQDNRTRARQRLDTAERSLDELEERNEAAAVRLRQAQEELSGGERRLAEGRNRITEAEETVTSMRILVDERREDLADLRLELAEKRQRLEFIDRQLGEIARKGEDLTTLYIRREQEGQGLLRQMEAMEQSIVSHARRAAELALTAETLSATLESRRTSLSDAETRTRELETGLPEAREALARAQDSLNKADVAFAREQSQLGFVVEEMRREYQLEPTSIDWRRELWFAGDPLPDRLRVPGDDEEDGPEAQPAQQQERPEPTDAQLAALEDTDWPPLADEILALRARIQSMGSVNLDAIAEYASLKGRHEFLRTQSDDLWKAKEQLVNAIDEINKISQQLFRETFEQIRKNFAYTFDALFGGGEADLQLIDNGDALEAGIEITARPPGTRLRTLQLLSGGQKTMTAVALLFGIYMVKPSPFCLLDELDAPLDDANVQRFTKMVRKFTEYSQFLIITHNKRTISAADTIYGVTMQEKGVSRLLSMRLDSPEAEAVIAASK